MSPGIKNILRLAAAVPYLNTTTLASTGLLTPIAVNQKMHLRFWCPIVTASTTAGLKVQLVVPGSGTSFLMSFLINNYVATHLALDNAGIQNASASFTGTLANVGNYLMVVEADIVNGSVAGNIILEAAQNTLDASNAVTFDAGCYLETEIF